MPRSCARKLLVSVLLSLCAPALAGCADEPEETNAQKLEREGQEFADALADYSAERKDEAVSKAREALADLDTRIDRLQERVEERWNEMDQSTREEARKNLEALKERRGELGVWYERLEESSAEAWSRMREGFSEAYSAFRDRWREAESEIDRET